MDKKNPDAMMEEMESKKLIVNMKKKTQKNLLKQKGQEDLKNLMVRN